VRLPVTRSSACVKVTDHNTSRKTPLDDTHFFIVVKLCRERSMSVKTNVTTSGPTRKCANSIYTHQLCAILEFVCLFVIFWGIQ
jgi:hypothetical protein